MRGHDLKKDRDWDVKIFDAIDAIFLLNLSSYDLWL